MLTLESRSLEIELIDYWHVGNGRGRGSHLDSVVDRESNGLPYIPGRMLKGLLRQAVYCLESWKHVPHGSTDTLFGGRDQPNDGEIFVSNARLRKDIADYLIQGEQDKIRHQLFTEYFSTAIDHESGSAKDKSLRGMELVVPCRLYCDVSLRTDHFRQGMELIKIALPLIRSVGAHRSRGLGRCEIRFLEGAQ